jgi:hypothetical protein
MGKNNQHAESSARVCGSKEEEETSIDCFSSFGFRVKESFWKKKHNTKKCVEVNYRGIFLLPDEILEMCLNRLPLTSLKNARLVCKRWSSFIIERRLLRMKNESGYQNLFLFVFGTLQHGDWSSNRDVNKIHALNLSRNIWYDYCNSTFFDSLLQFYLLSSILKFYSFLSNFQWMPCFITWYYNKFDIHPKFALSTW